MNKLRQNTLNIVFIAVFSAILSGGKLALSFIPNIEIVSLVIVLISCTLGINISLPSTIIFVITDCLIYGFNSWVISYYIYWPLFAVIIYIVNYKGLKKPLQNAIITAFMTLIFGIITTFIDTSVSGAIGSGIFFRIFSVMYIRGIPYFAIHIISNFIIILLLFKPLTKIFIKLKSIYNL